MKLALGKRIFFSSDVIRVGWDMRAQSVIGDLRAILVSLFIRSIWSQNQMIVGAMHEARSR
jgi:hypothetical protein